MKEHITTPFGVQLFEKLELSAMTEVDPDGFYKCLMSVDIMNFPPSILKEYTPSEERLDTKKRKVEEKVEVSKVEEKKAIAKRKCCVVL